MNTDVPMSKIYESDIEQMAIEQLQAIGYRHVYGVDIEPSGIKPLRAYSQVLLQDNVLQAIATINPQLTPEQCLEAYQRISQHNQLTAPNNVSNNLAFHRLLTEGIALEIHKDGNTQGEQVWLIDWNEPSNNEFLVINQLTITHDSPKGKYKRRPDLILYINGIPLVVIELKNATDANATIQGAYNQIQTYQDQIPQLFTYNAFCVVSDGLEAKAGTLSADFSRYMTWKTKTGDTEAHRHEPQLNVLIQDLLNPVTLLDMVRHFIVFEASKTEDKNGIITISNIKKMAAYHQYYAVNKAVLSTIRASSENSDEDDTPENNLSNKKAGVVWHTQGSGKSLSMVFYTGKIVLAMNNPTVVILTDRNDLDDQLFATFSASVQLLRQSPKQAGHREQLKELLKVNSGGVIFTTIQKFQPEDGSNVYDTLSERHNIIVIADEAHRSQYGFAAKEVDVKNDAGDVTGKRTVYGFAKYLRDALPNATYLGFTGTPIEKNDVNTPAVFGDYVDIYDISQAVEDGATVRIFYESRLAKVAISDEGKKLIADFDEEFNEDELTATQQARAKWVKAEALIGSHDRIQAVAADIVQHFEQRLFANANQGKGMIVAMSRRVAVDLYNAIIALRPAWSSDDLYDGVIKVIMTSSAADGAALAKHHTTKKDRQILANRMKDPEDKLKLVIVRDMWLTGFDAPSMHTLYIDKPMKGHNLMQAIARVNRVYKDKAGGLIVDYLGIAADLKEALSFYSDAGGKGDPAVVQDEAVIIMKEKLEVYNTPRKLDQKIVANKIE